MKKTNLIIVGAIVALIVAVLGVVAVFGFKTQNEAPKHLQAVLDHRFKGDIEGRMKYAKEGSETELQVQYEESILSFVKGNILSGAEVDEETTQKYVEQCKKLFASMKYEIGKSKEINERKFEVKVTYQPADFFAKFIAAADAESQRIYEKYQRGEYRGTEDEINAEMKNEFLENAIGMFETACESMEYGESQSMIFTITKTKDGEYQINPEEIVEFTIKILRLDEIQD